MKRKKHRPEQMIRKLREAYALSSRPVREAFDNPSSRVPDELQRLGQPLDCHWAMRQACLSWLSGESQFPRKWFLPLMVATAHPRALWRRPQG